MSNLRRLAQRLLPLLDLAVPGTADEQTVLALCREASTPAGTVAAVCLPAHFIAASKRTLRGTGIAIAALAGSATGAAAAVADGADEIELLLPAAIDGIAEALEAARAAIGRKPLLKAVLETGRLGDPAAIRAAAEAAIRGGADFLVTSSGAVEPGANLEAAEAMLAAIAAARADRRWAGFKAAGGIRTLSDALPYLSLYDRMMGDGAASAASFRLGSDTLLNQVLIALGLPAGSTTGG